MAPNLEMGTIGSQDVIVKGGLDNATTAPQAGVMNSRQFTDYIPILPGVVLPPSELMIKLAK